MDNSVSNYSADSLTKRVYSKYSTNAVDTNVTEQDAGYLDFDGYLKLMVAQMSNQDFNDPMSDSEFIQQMASYSMMEAIKQLTTQNAVSYSSSLIGKAVTVNGANGIDTGMVEAVTIADGKAMVLVNGTKYSSDDITDVVDGDVYTRLSSFIGQTIEVKDGENTVTGDVTNIYISNGNGYVVVNGADVYGLSAIVRVVKDEENELSDDETDASQAASETVMPETAASADLSSASGAASAISSASQAAYNTLLSMLDDNKEPEEKGMATVDVVTAASGLMSGNDSDFGADSTYTIPTPFVQGRIQTDRAAAKPENTATVSTAGTARAVNDGEQYGVSTVDGSDAAYKLPINTKFGDYVENTDYFPSSNRKYADGYPAEAAYADYVGTEMTDIRFIKNTAITSKIDTRNIMGYTASGKAFTDIGFSGKGRLGEVVTFADGTQRVEVIGRNSSQYFWTSGKLTLDQICDFDCPPGSLAGKLTPFETAIRYWSREYTAAEMAEMASFEDYVRHLAVGYPATIADL